MRGDELLDSMDLVDAAYLEEADAQTRKNTWILWEAVAASLCLVVSALFVFVFLNFPGSAPIATDPNISFTEPTGSVSQIDPIGSTPAPTEPHEIQLLSSKGMWTSVPMKKGRIVWKAMAVEHYWAVFEGELYLENNSEYSMENIPGSDRYCALIAEGPYSYLVDVQTGQVLDPLAALEQDALNHLSGVRFSPDGRLAMITYRGSTVLELLDCASGNSVRLPYAEDLYSVSGEFLDNDTVMIFSTHQDADGQINWSMSRYEIASGECEEIPGRYTSKDRHAENFLAMVEVPFAYTFTEGKLKIIDLRTMEQTIYPLRIDEVESVSCCMYMKGSILVHTEQRDYLLNPQAAGECNALFESLGSWYNVALVCEYATPEKIDLYEFFLNGFMGEPTEPTDAELEELRDMPGFMIELGLKRLPVQKMNQVLRDCFGITLDKIDKAGFEGLIYLERTDCYYIIGDGASCVLDFNALSVETMEDGAICVYYMKYDVYDEDAVYVVTLVPDGDDYKICSNVRAQ